MTALLVWFTVQLSAACLQSDTDLAIQVESTLRTANLNQERASLLKIASEADLVKTLVAIVQTKSLPYLKLVDAFALVGTFKSQQAVDGLAELMAHRDPLVRCLAIGALTSIGTPAALPVLVKALDDQSVCMQTVFTDPARQYDVFVSDIAVEALENVTKRKFEPVSGDPPRHRDTRPWKKWWQKSAGQAARAGSSSK